MTKTLVVRDAQGNNQQVDTSISMYRDAAERNQSLPQYLASKYPVNAAKDGTPFEQLLEQCGVFVQGNKEFGFRPSTLEDVLAPKEASAITREGVPASRWLFPAVILEVIENKLNVNYDVNPAALSSMVAKEDAINGERWERPVISYAAVETARGAPVAQLAMPNAMMSITASDKAMRIPTWGIGLEISEQAQRSTTLDLVGLAVARQAQIETNERANAYILSLLNGDTDMGMLALSTFSGKVQTCQSLNGGVAAGAGVLTQKAWVTWLSQRSNKRMITHVVTDIAGAMMIENRSGKPVITNDNPNSPRIDTLMSVMNPKWPDQVKIFITDDVNWPANTIMGVDSRYGIHRVTSLSAQYSAIEQFAIKRSTMLRIDKGEMVYRLFDEAFEVLTTLA
jgi:hypothetical protein